MKPAMTPQQSALTGESGGALSLYKSLAVGTRASWLHFVHYEFLTFFLSNMTGILGFGGRALLYPGLLKRCGKRPAIGRGVVIRNPQSISFGDKILIDDYAALDVRGEAGEISLGNFVSIGRFTTVTAKQGAVTLHDGANIGSYCRIATQSKVVIGESTLVAAYCYIGPGNHQAGDEDTPLISREMDIRGGVHIGKNCWIGAGALILDGVTIGDGAIVGAHALVRDDVPAGAVVVGSPARIIKTYSKTLDETVL